MLSTNELRGRLLKIEEVKDLLRELGFPPKSITDQTALTLLALADQQPREGLLSGHSTLSQGARLHDILNFVRSDFKPVAENTRESYRKTSLRPLIAAGWVIRHQLTTNDPNTYYRLNEELLRLLRMELAPEREQLASRLRLKSAGRPQKLGSGGEGVGVRISAKAKFQLSPGAHNELEREIVEQLAPAILIAPAVVYLGDTAPRAGYQNRTLMRRLNLPIDVTSSLPDVVLFDQQGEHLLIVEAVTSSGVITEGRLHQLRAFARGPSNQGLTVSYLTVFPDRRTFRRFVEEIAWGTKVWISQEPANLIHFQPIRPEGETDPDR